MNDMWSVVAAALISAKPLYCAHVVQFGGRDGRRRCYQKPGILALEK
jgi:hypothetical protein